MLRAYTAQGIVYEYAHEFKTDTYLGRISHVPQTENTENTQELRSVPADLDQ